MIATSIKHENEEQIPITVDSLSNADAHTINVISADQMKWVYDHIVRTMTDQANYLRIISLLNDMQIKELAELLLISLYRYPNYGMPFVRVETYEDTGAPAYLNIIFENCNWEEWKSLEEDLLSVQDLLKGLVAITCLLGLTE